MKTGDYVISNIKEIVNEKKKVCGYMMNYPQLVKYNDASILLVEKSIEADSEKTEREVEVTLSPWIILTDDLSIPVGLDAIVALANPLSTLEDMFVEKCKNSGYEIEEDEEDG